MTRLLSRREYLSGRTATDTHLVPRERPFYNNPSRNPGASALGEDGDRFFASGDGWYGDLPAGSEVFLPPWVSIPNGWFEVGNAAGLPAGRKLIANKFSLNYTDNDTISWVIIDPSNMYTDPARTSQVSTSPGPVGGITDTTILGNHWYQNTSANRMLWYEYTRDTETVYGLRSDNSNQYMTVPVDNTGTGSILVFFEDSAFYAESDFQGSNTIDFYSTGLMVEEVVIFSRKLTSSELVEFVENIKRERNRQFLDNWTSIPDTLNLRGVFRNWWWITEFPVIDITGKTNLKNTWRGCEGYKSFPKLNTSSVENFRNTWYSNRGLLSFPKINTISGVNFNSTWYLCWKLTSFPKLNFENGKDFDSTWRRCDALEDFPENMFDNTVTNNFSRAFESTSLTQQSVDNILISIANMLSTYNTDGSLDNGSLGINGGNAATPSSAGKAAADTLRAAGWTVNLNGY